MKAFLGIILLVFLASCGTVDTMDTTTQVDDIPRVVSEERIVPEENNEGDDDEKDNNEGDGDAEESESKAEIEATVDAVLEDILESETSVDSEANTSVTSPETVSEPTPVATSQTVTTSTTYNNPKGRVDMNIEYVLSSNGTIESISVTSPNYAGMVGFNAGVQAVVGMTVEEASEYYVSGSSLTNPAFQAAMKQG